MISKAVLMLTISELRILIYKEEVIMNTKTLRVSLKKSISLKKPLGSIDPIIPTLCIATKTKQDYLGQVHSIIKGAMEANVAEQI